MALVGLIITILYAPAATKKQPIPRRLVKRKILSIFLYCTIVVISLVTKEPVNKLILFGVILESLTLLPIFFPKEDINHGKHFNLFIKFFTTILEFIGTVAGDSVCASYFDEPEVPEELTKLYE